MIYFVSTILIFQSGAEYEKYIKNDFDIFVVVWHAYEKFKKNKIIIL